ncbi:MAG: TonB-dependent receptor [Bacteroidales bacterium]|nr:TonB-dependent receptor [Bacteroidales bacterium]
MKYLSLIILLTISLTALAQERLISGKVTDESGMGLPGVTVQLKGTSTGTTTDLDGKYKINLNAGILRFSYIGFVPQEITITNQSSINIVLLEETKQLNEVVIIGYGTQKKKDLTTAVSVVGEKEIRDRPLVSAAQALQGKAAGVQVTQPSGKPGSSLSVRVRGATSVLAGNEPLYVVDGLPTTDISGLSPTDIASMSVLKDASSAAIYGARAANGVVLITTKRGETNNQKVSFNTYYGVSKLRKTVEVLGTKDYRDLLEEISPGSYSPLWTKYTNWSEEVFGTGFNQSYQLSATGGSEKMKYFVSGGYLSEQGIVQPAKFDRYSFRINLDNDLNPWLKIGTNISILSLKSKDTPDNLSSGRGGVIMSALNTPPFLQIYKSDGSGWFDPNPFQPSWENPVAYMEGPDQEASDNKVFGSFNAEAKLYKDVFLKSRLGVDLNTHQWDYYLDPFRTSYGRKEHGIGTSSKGNSSSVLWENTLDYSLRSDNHTFTALIGSSIQKYAYKESYLSGSNFPEDVSIQTLWAANTITGGTSGQQWALASFFGRASYDYMGKYYLTGSIRRDGSSKLANPWGTMPSFSAGWRISSEKFMQGIDFIDDLKIRGGWGKTGNQEGIPNYTQYGLANFSRITLGPNDPLLGPAFYQYTYGNPDLRWETTSQTNIGIDLTAFNSRLVLNLDVYMKKTVDVLMNVQLPSYLPITTIQTNVGEIVNKGLELNISTVNIDKKIRWNSDFNISFNKNEVTALKYTDVYYFGRIYSNNSDVAIVKVGLPLGSFYGYISEGVDPLTGNLKYKDVNDNGIFDTGDRTVIGDAQPDFIFGFTNNISYKRFDLNIFFQGSYGNDIYNATRIDLEGMFDSKNQSTAVLRRWTTENTDTDIPKVGNMDNVRNSSRFIEDGSYVRLKSLTLSYKVFTPNEIKAFNKLSVYVTGQNLLTFTNYSGFDPEVNAYGNSATEMGIDYGTYPQSRSLIIGLNVEF